MAEEFSITLARRGSGGEWTELATFGLSEWDRAQLCLLLSGINLTMYSALPVEAQRRVLESLAEGNAPSVALN